MTTNVYFQPENVLAQELDDELILLHLDSELYISLDSVGKRFWTLAVSEQSVSQILDTLESEYAASRDTLEADFCSFIGALQRYQLIGQASRST